MKGARPYHGPAGEGLQGGKDRVDVAVRELEGIDHLLTGPSDEWAYQFELIRKDGLKHILSANLTDAVVMPASTFKLFTSWWAYEKKARSDAYLAEMLHKSVNQMAQDTFELLGGAIPMETFLDRIDIPISSSNFYPTDGSGLSHNTRTTVSVEMKLLEKILSNPKYDDYKELLAQPTEYGTLVDRLTEFKGKLFAKTGTLDGVAALSGFLETSKGIIVFSIISNQLTTSIDTARDKIDNTVRKIYKEVETEL